MAGATAANHAVQKTGGKPGDKSQSDKSMTDLDCEAAYALLASSIGVIDRSRIAYDWPLAAREE